jgi:hypothetical protein
LILHRNDSAVADLRDKLSSRRGAIRRDAHCFSFAEAAIARYPAIG